MKKGWINPPLCPYCPLLFVVEEVLVDEFVVVLVEATETYSVTVPSIVVPAGGY